MCYFIKINLSLNFKLKKEPDGSLKIIKGGFGHERRNGRKSGSNAGLV